MLTPAQENTKNYNDKNTVFLLERPEVSLMAAKYARVKLDGWIYSVA